MATNSSQLDKGTSLDEASDEGVKSLQQLLADSQKIIIAYDVAAVLRQSLLSFFEAFCEDEVEGGENGDGAENSRNSR